MNMRFRLARVRQRLTQEQVALQAQINQADVSRIETQDWTPPRVIRDRLASVLQTPVEELFGETQSLAS